MDTGFHYNRNIISAMNRHAISFQSSGVDSTSEMIMMGDYHPMNNNSATISTSFLGNSSLSNSNSGFTQSANSCDSVPGLKHDAGLAVEWSVEEQHKLEEGLSIFGYEPSMMRYIKIAATLRDKTVRDVALRCRWMVINLIESSSKPIISSVQTLGVAPFSVTMNNRVLTDAITFEALSGSIRHLIEQNNQILNQISANISSMKLQDNINLFNHTKNNISAILNNMRYMPGPPFPISLNENLAHSILPTTSQRMMFEASNRMYRKQEPGF